MYSLGYNMVIGIKTFLPNKLVHYLRNNFVTDQFNRSKLTGCPLENIQHSKKQFKIVNGDRE